MKIKFIKNTQTSGFRKNDIVDISENRANQYIKHGYAVEYKQEDKPLVTKEENLIKPQIKEDKKSKTKKKEDK